MKETGQEGTTFLVLLPEEAPKSLVKFLGEFDLESPPEDQ